jgi:hypothetical protein
MRALYDLSRYLTCFNVFEWLLQVEARGATMVVFDARYIRSDKWPYPYNVQRFESICEPAPALIGLPHETWRQGAGIDLKAHDMARPGGGPLVEFWRGGGRFKRLRTVREPGNERYTVTLRKTQRAPGRNSDEEMWRDFAREIGARVIPDYDEEPIHLHDRIALYAGAEMNFFVSNGPGILCSFTEYPCMMFNTHQAAGSLKGDGLGWGEQYPWMLANQRSIWEEATGESVRSHFEHWRERGSFLERARAAPAA